MRLCVQAQNFRIFVEALLIFNVEEYLSLKVQTAGCLRDLVDRTNRVFHLAPHGIHNHSAHLGPAHEQTPLSLYEIAKGNN